MTSGAPGSFGAQLKSLREAAGFTQEELATIAGLSVHAVSALERGQRRRPHVETVRALSAALDLTGAARDALLGSARAIAHNIPADGLGRVALPVPLTRLLGRDADLDTLRRWLGDPAARLITLIGPGGVGKTRLALELARTVADDLRLRVVFLGLAAIQDAAFVAPAIAEAFELSDATTVDLPRRVRAASDDQPTLLVLDNCEHVLDAAPLVADLLASAPSLRVCATSRAPLRIRGEREYLLGPLALDNAESLSPADVARMPAVRLFMERVRDGRADFRLTASNGQTVTAICRRLDALPLALELAAPWIKVLTPEELLQRLERDVLLTTIGPRDLPERQQTMNATVAWSYRLLNRDDQRAFRRLGLLPGQFPIAAAADVLAGADRQASNDEALTAVARLMDKSLILPIEPGAAKRQQYRMLESVRAYASIELTAAGERDDAYEGLVRYCVGEATLAEQGLVGIGQVEWLERVRDDLDCHRGALTWFIQRGRAAEASRIAWGLMFFWVIRGHGTEGVRWYEQILGMPSLPPSVELRALAGSGVMWYTQGELERARLAMQRALLLARDTGEREMVAQAENLLGHVELASGNMNGARERFESALQGFRALEIPWGSGNALSGLAWVALAANDLADAERLLDGAADALRDAGPWFRELGLYLRAVIAVRRERPDEAIAFVHESLKNIQRLHDRFAFVYALVPLASAAVLKGDDVWAARILGAREAVTERTGATIVDHSVNDLREKAEREAQARLGPNRWARAYAAGRSASIDSLLKDIENARR